MFKGAQYTIVLIICTIMINYTSARVVDIGAIHISDIYQGAPNREILLNAIVGASSETMRALHVFEKYTNDNWLEVDGERVTFNIVIKETDYSSNSNLAAICDILNEDINFVILPFGTSPGNFVTNAIDNNLCGLDNPRTIIQFSGSTQEKTFGHGKNSTFATMPTLHGSLRQLIPYFREKGRSVTFLKTTGSRPMDPAISTCHDLEDIFIQSGLLKMDTLWYDGDFINADPSNYTNVMNMAKEIDNDVIIHCGIDRNIMIELAKALKELNYTPKGIITTANEMHVNETILDYWTVTSTVVASDLSFEDADYIKNTEEYLDIYTELFPEESLSENYKMGLFTMFACEILLKSMQLSDTVDDIDSILKKLKFSRFNSMLGEIYYSSTNENQNGGVSLQKLPESMGIIGPYQVTNASLIYPMPTWSEREYDTRYHASEIGMIVILSIGMINIMVWSIILVLKQVQTLDFMIISIGGLFILIGTLLWTPSHIFISSCVTIPILLSIGLTLIIGIIVYRMITLYRPPKHFYKYLIIFGLLLCMINMALFVLWNTLAKPEVSRKILDPHIISGNYKFCDFKRWSGLFIGLVSIPIILIYGTGIILSFFMINNTFRSYPQKKVFAFSLYNIGICAIVIMILEIIGISHNIFIQSTLRTIIILLSIGVTTTLMAIHTLTLPEILHRYAYSSSSYDKNTSSGSRKYSSSSTTLSDSDRFYIQKIEEYKKDAKQFRKEIKEMKEELLNITSQQM